MSKWPDRQPWHDGERIQFDYDDYILSCVRFTGSYGWKANLWEVAFMDRETQDFVEPPLDFMSEYSFSGDVGIYGHLNDPDVDRIHKAMSNLGTL